MILASLLVPVLAQDAFAAEMHLTGTVAFRDDGPVPPDSVLRVVLADVSRGPGVPARALGEMITTRPEGPPYRFDIAFDSQDIRPNGTYVIRAELSSGGFVLFRSRGLLPVLTRGAPSEATLWLARLAQPETGGTGGLQLPASFAGALPCNDCKSVRYRLDLWPDRVFQLRRSWEGKDMQRDSIGRWSIDSASRNLVLQGEDEFRFDVLGSDRLRLVKPAVPGPVADGVLTASIGFEPFEPDLAMRGMVTWAGDEASFLECTTGREYPLVENGDYEALEHAYLAAGVEPGSALMASLDGRIVQGKHPESGGGAVEVERFVGVWPGETCEHALSPATLRNTYWRIVRLGDTEVAARPDRREPSLILRDGERRFSATVGCNPLSGRFTLKDDGLRFGPMTAPRLDCPTGLQKLEEQFIGALEATAQWRIDGQSLELMDATGKQVAMLQAVYLY